MFLTKTDRLMLCSEIIAVYCYDHARCIQGVSGGIVNILGGGSMDYSE